MVLLIFQFSIFRQLGYVGVLVRGLIGYVGVFAREFSNPLQNYNFFLIYAKKSAVFPHFFYV